MGEQLSILEEYIKQGLEKGFNINYIKDVLIQHGHHHDKVHTAANNVMGLQYPDHLKPHLDEARKRSGGNPLLLWTLGVAVVILIIITVWLIAASMSQRHTIQQASNELSHIQGIGNDVQDITTAIKTQNELLKDRDLTIAEKEKIIKDQVRLIDNAHSKLEDQRQKLNVLLLDLLNRMIGRLNNPSE